MPPGLVRRSITLGLVVAATVIGGLFSSLLDRALVATPACGGTLACKRGPTTVVTPIWLAARSFTPSANPAVDTDLRGGDVAPP